MEVCGLRIEGIPLLTTVGLLPLASFSIAGGGFGPGAEVQWRTTLDGPSRSPAGEGQTPGCFAGRQLLERWQGVCPGRQRLCGNGVQAPPL